MESCTFCTFCARSVFVFHTIFSLTYSAGTRRRHIKMCRFRYFKSDFIMSDSTLSQPFTAAVSLLTDDIFDVG